MSMSLCIHISLWSKMKNDYAILVVTAECVFQLSCPSEPVPFMPDGSLDISKLRLVNTAQP